jgi:hypothetical protein
MTRTGALRLSLLSGSRQLVSANSKSESVTATLAEKRSGRSLRTERVKRRVLPVLGDDRAFALRLRTTIPPVGPDRSPLVGQPLDHRVVATVGHHGASGPSNSAHERPTGAHPPRRIEDDNGVRSLQAKIERLVIVAVSDPGIACEQVALLLPPLVIRRPHPSRLPIVEVEMDHRKAGLRRQGFRERALPGAGHPGDDDATADGPRCMAHQSQCPGARRRRADVACRGTRRRAI